jgi:hypothetical protein
MERRYQMNKKTTTIIATLAAALLFSTVGMASAVMIDGHNITFINHTYDDGTNISTWCYNVTSGSSAALSHWTICWCTNNTINDTSEQTWEYVEPNPNNKINMSGIKFDDDYEDGESRDVCFTLHGNYSEAWINVSTKAGNNDEVYGWVIGPADHDNCPGCIVPELSTSILVSVGLLTLIGYFTLRRKD